MFSQEFGGIVRASVPRLPEDAELRAANRALAEQARAHAEARKKEKGDKAARHQAAQQRRRLKEDRAKQRQSGIVVSSSSDDERMESDSGSMSTTELEQEFHDVHGGAEEPGSSRQHAASSPAPGRSGPERDAATLQREPEQHQEPEQQQQQQSQPGVVEGSPAVEPSPTSIRGQKRGSAAVIPGSSESGSKKRWRSQGPKTPQGPLRVAPTKRLSVQATPGDPSSAQPAMTVTRVKAPALVSANPPADTTEAGAKERSTREVEVASAMPEARIAPESIPVDGDVGRGAMEEAALKQQAARDPAMGAGPSNVGAVDPWEAAASKAAGAHQEAQRSAVQVQPSAVQGKMGWQTIVNNAEALESIASHLRAAVTDGYSAFRRLENQVADATSREAAAVADARGAEEKLMDLMRRCQKDDVEHQRVLGELKTARQERDAAKKAKDDADGVNAQLAEENAQLKRSVEGLKTMVSRSAEEVEGEGGDHPRFFFDSFCVLPIF